jgi:hypothetical protein
LDIRITRSNIRLEGLDYFDEGAYGKSTQSPGAAPLALKLKEVRLKTSKKNFKIWSDLHIEECFNRITLQGD